MDLELLESETGLTPDRLAATVQHQLHHLHHLHQSHGRGQGLGTGFIGVASIRRALAVVQREHRTQVALKTDLTAKGDLYATIALTGKNVNRQLVRPGVAQGTPTKSSVSQDRLKGVDASLEFSASTSIPTVVEQLGPTESFIFLSGTDHPNPTDMPSSLVFDESPATCALSELIQNKTAVTNVSLLASATARSKRNFPSPLALPQALSHHRRIRAQVCGRPVGQHPQVPSERPVPRHVRIQRRGSNLFNPRADDGTGDRQSAAQAHRNHPAQTPAQPASWSVFCRGEIGRGGYLWSI